MYRVLVRVLLAGGNGTMLLSRQLWLPFVPFPGLVLHHLAADPNEEAMLLVIGWDPVESCFYADLPDWCDQDEGIAEMIDYFGPGWELHEPGQLCHEVE